MTTENNLISTSALIDTVAEATGQTKTSTKATVDALLQAITDGVVGGSEVRLNGVGTISSADTTERQGINLQTKAQVTYPASKRVAFKASKTLKDLVKATVA